MRTLLATAALVAGSGLVAQVDPPEPPVQHVYVQPGEGLWTVASRLCPHDTATVYVALQQANPWYTVGLHPDTVLHVPADACPPPTTTSTSTSTSTTTVPAGFAFPTPETTGPRTTPTVTINGAMRSSATGQTIQNCQIAGILTIVHSNVTVRDCVVAGIVVEAPTTGSSPPRGVLIEYVEVNAASIDPSTNAVRLRPGTEVTIDHSYLHDCGRCVAISTDTTITNNYMMANRTWVGAHRQAIICSGGTNHRIVGNTLYCIGGGCSSSVSLYGDVATIDGVLLEHNLLSTSGSYAIYGGSEPQKPYPNGANVHLIDNHFSTLYGANGGVYGPITGHADGVRGNVRYGNVWHETGQPIPGG